MGSWFPSWSPIPPSLSSERFRSSWAPQVVVTASRSHGPAPTQGQVAQRVEKGPNRYSEAASQPLLKVSCLCSLLPGRISVAEVSKCGETV